MQCSYSPALPQAHYNPPPSKITPTFARPTHHSPEPKCAPTLDSAGYAAPASMTDRPS